jgi:hypothetical protein
MKIFRGENIKKDSENILKLGITKHQSVAN